ncbi:MAG: molybdopterin molybdotransferase MoeA [Synergistetes bacterium]|nr:molybdopterin molybdotransferase MoeA [Synergistota bacterium]
MRRVISREEAIDLLSKEGSIGFRSKSVSLVDTIGRRSALRIMAPFDLPELSRSTRDGYAVNHLDLKGVSESMPAYLTLIGEIKVGEVPNIFISPGEAVRVFTGSYLPEGADAVVMNEFVEESQGTVQVYKSVAPGENIFRKGEDWLGGTTILDFGERISIGKVGLLAAYGFNKVEILELKVGIVSTGDEIVSPGAKPSLGKIYDINSFTLYALLRSWGADPWIYGVVPDDLNMLLQALEETLEKSDVVVFSGGSSIGARDYTKELFKKFNGNLVIEGINISPGKPTIAGWIRNKPVFGLPGHPVSSIVAARVFLIPIIERMLGIEEDKPLFLPLLTNLPSKLGVEEFVIASLSSNGVVPVLGKSGAIGRIAKGGFLIRIPEHVEGYNKGEVVEVWNI